MTNKGDNFFEEHFANEKGVTTDTKILSQTKALPCVVLSHTTGMFFFPYFFFFFNFHVHQLT